MSLFVTVGISVPARGQAELVIGLGAVQLYHNNFGEYSPFQDSEPYQPDTGFYAYRHDPEIPRFTSWALWPHHSVFHFATPFVGHVQRILVIPLWLLAFLCLAWPVTSFLLARRRRGRGFPVYWKATGHVGPAHISIIGSVETGASGRSHYCRVRGPDAAEALASFLRSRGVPVTVHRAGGEKRIIHFPDSLSIEQASVDLARYQSLLCEFPEFQPEPEYG